MSRLHRQRPCAECPWRRDTPPGRFTAERYQALRDTTGSAGHDAPLGSPMFACHKAPPGREQACAGWLAAVGYYSLTVRANVALGAIPPSALTPGRDWPELYATYDEMAAAQGRP